MNVFFVLLLLVALSAFWASTLLNLPGNWLIVLATAIYVYFMPADSWASIGWTTVVLILGLAALGELIEMLAGATGAAKAGGSRRGVVFALAGSILGGILGVLVGVPVPLLGPIIAALLFASLGAMAGAMLGEMSAGKNLAATWRIGRAAFRGRLAGTVAKMLIGAAMLAVVAVAILL